MMNTEEEITWKLIQQKDLAAFERYYKENYTAFFLIACKYLKDAQRAREIVNDIFVKLWQESGNLSIDTSLKSYLYRAVINRCLDTLDKQKRERQDFREWSRRPEEPVVLRHMEDNEFELRVLRAIDQLPEQCRKVFRMSREEKLKQQEIARRLGISIKTVKNHMTHALKLLGKLIGDQ